jgi:hypothetical protein
MIIPNPQPLRTVTFHPKQCGKLTLTGKTKLLINIPVEKIMVFGFSKIYLSKI